MFAFELTSVLLVIAVVGTVLLARAGTEGVAGDRDVIAARRVPTTTWYLVLAAVLFGIGTRRRAGAAQPAGACSCASS